MARESKAAKHICTGDTVLVTTGNDKGETGKVLKRKGERILVQGINIRKKHVKPTQQAPKGQVLSIEMAIHASNLALVDSNGQKVKLKTRINAEGKREQVYLSNGQEVLFRTGKQAK